MAELDPGSTRGTDRPRHHTGTSETEVAVFAATERLIAETPLHDLTVAQIIHAADVSRATFYFYFSSKYAVLAGLLAGIMDEVFELSQPFISRDESVPPQVALMTALQSSIELWASHRPAMRAIHEHWNTTPELRTMWIGVVKRFTEGIALQIERQRELGLAPEGLPSRQLAAMLLWATERNLYVAGLGVDENLPDEQEILVPLLTMWAGTLYFDPSSVAVPESGG